MSVGLHDNDQTKYPNLALMKLSAYHEDSEKYIFGKQYDTVFSSKVFTYTPDELLPEDTICGGTGNDLQTKLPDEIEHICPDYSLYGLNYSMGFLTRGCPNKCSWCFVPEKEGDIYAHADIEEFARHKDVVLMDNNVLAHSHGIQQIEKIATLGLKVDFNQGLDARLIDDGIARRLSKIKWLNPLRLACDQKGQIETVRKAVELLRWHNVTPRTYFCYVLVNDVEDALERIKMLKGMNIDPFAQPYRDKKGTAPTKAQRRFSRWVNHKAIFKSVVWEDYK